MLAHVIIKIEHTQVIIYPWLNQDVTIGRYWVNCPHRVWLIICVLSKDYVGSFCIVSYNCM